MVGANYLPVRGGDNPWIELFKKINDEYNGDAPFDGNTVYGMSVGYLFVQALEKAGKNPTRQGIVDAIQSGDLVGNGLVPPLFGADSHAADPRRWARPPSTRACRTTSARPTPSTAEP